MDGAPALDTRRIAIPGRNCWRSAAASRFAMLVDASAYFSAVADAMERARREIFILAWDIDSRIRLRPEPDFPPLAKFLDGLARRQPGLRIRILSWDFSMVFALERQLFPVFQLGWRTHRNVRFVLDGKLPLAASQHVKVVVVDDAVAFVGGLDLTQRRWDTPGHRARDPRRVDPGGEAYGPFHDVQVAVDGEAAVELSRLARARWKLVTGEDTPEPEALGDPWPRGVRPDLDDVEVAIARTIPDHPESGGPGVREVERLFLDGIAAARDCIYVENQYFTGAKIGDALAQRLSEANGPEIVVVGPKRCSGWLEEDTMGVLRAELVKRLRSADRFGRLGFYAPEVPDVEGRGVNLHSKVMVVDDAHFHAGSANMSNRSMAVDTECDLAVDAAGCSRVAAGITAARNRLLAEHLGAERDAVARSTRERGLLGGIEALRGSGRSLARFEPPEPGVAVDIVVPARVLVDPEKPRSANEIARNFLPEVDDERASALWKTGLMLGVPVALAAAWKLTPLREIGVDDALAWVRPLREAPWGPVAAVGGFALLSFLACPVTLLIFLTGLLFGPWPGVPVALGGVLLAAVAGQVAGRSMRRETLGRLLPRRANKLARLLRGHQVASVALVRLVPVAPFAVVNLAAGAAGIRLRPFVLGTLIGMTPGLLAILLFARGLRSLVVEPGLGTVLLMLAVAALVVAGALVGRRLAGRDDD